MVSPPPPPHFLPPASPPPSHSRGCTRRWRGTPQTASSPVSSTNVQEGATALSLTPHRAPGRADGHFLLRHAEGHTHILSVVYHGKPTHHKVAAGGGGALVVNGKQYGAPASLEELVATLTAADGGWPVPLTGHVSAAAPSRPPRKAASGAGKDKGGGEWVPHSFRARARQCRGAGPWLAAEMSRDEADAAVLAEGGANGRFLVRPSEGAYILSLAYRGKGTHHSIKKREDGVYTVNGKAYGAPTSLARLIKLLSKPCEGWPCVLTEPAQPPAAAEPSRPPRRSAPKSSATSELQPEAEAEAGGSSKVARRKKKAKAAASDLGQVFDADADDGLSFADEGLSAASPAASVQPAVDDDVDIFGSGGGGGGGKPAKALTGWRLKKAQRKAATEAEAKGMTYGVKQAPSLQPSKGLTRLRRPMSRRTAPNLWAPRHPMGCVPKPRPRHPARKAGMRVPRQA